jgi:sRNA-binding carbon storage regulator CsrA
MLVVSMKEAGILRIGEATIYIREIRGGEVRISVAAPQEIKIKHLEPVAGDEVPRAEVVRRGRMGRR